MFLRTFLSGAEAPIERLIIKSDADVICPLLKREALANYEFHNHGHKKIRLSTRTLHSYLRYSIELPKQKVYTICDIYGVGVHNM